MQNVMSVPSAACVNFEAFGKLLNLNMHCLVIKLPFVAICALFRVISGGKFHLFGLFE